MNGVRSSHRHSARRAFWRLPAGPFVLTALSLLSSEIRAQTDRPIEARWSCFTEYGQSTIYTTPVWYATALLIEVTNHFAQFLLAEYDYKGRVSCGGALLSTSTTAQLTDDNARTRALWRGEGKSVIETTYTFDPAKASLAFACIGFSRVRVGTAYADSIFLSPVLRIPGNSQYRLTLAWNEYLEKSHPESPTWIPRAELLARRAPRDRGLSAERPCLSGVRERVRQPGRRLSRS